MRFRCLSWSSAALGTLLLVGCGSSSGPEKIVVEGNVTFDGQPIPNGEIMFYPIEGTPGSVAGGPIKDGKYTAKSRGGVPVGRHRVEIRAFRAPSKPQTGPDAVEGGAAEQYLPLQYNAYSELTSVVDASNPTQNFDLTAK